MSKTVKPKTKSSVTSVKSGSVVKTKAYENMSDLAKDNPEIADVLNDVRTSKIVVPEPVEYDLGDDDRYDAQDYVESKFGKFGY